MKSVHVLQRERIASKPGFRVTVHREPCQPPMHQHRHNFYEIIWVLGGTGVHVADGFRHRIGPGDVMVIDPKRLHGYEDTESLNLINLLLDPSLFPACQDAFSDLHGFQRLFVLSGDQWEQKEYSNRLRLTEQDAEDLSEWINRMEAETHSDARESAVLAESWAFQIIGLLSRRGDRLLPRPSKPQAPPSGVNRLFSWIELHLEEPLRVEDLAREAGMSVRTLQRSFQQRAGSSPMDYLRERRMARAERLLRPSGEPSLSIREIGARCGYTDPAHFASAVKAHFGSTPRHLRETLRSG